MKNRITVSIGGQKYTFVVTDDGEYTRTVAAYVDEKLSETRKDDKLGLINATVLAAMNIADERFKERDNAENLRRQVKELLEESSRLKLELSKAKQEIFKLSKGQQNDQQNRHQNKHQQNRHQQNEQRQQNRQQQSEPQPEEPQQLSLQDEK